MKMGLKKEVLTADAEGKTKKNVYVWEWMKKEAATFYCLDMC